MSIRPVISNAEALQKVAGDFSRVARAVKTNRIITRLANIAVHEIKRETCEGRDLKGRPFKPYSEQHEAARRARGLPVDRVTLSFTGAMQSSIRSIIHSPRRAELVTTDPKAEGHQKGKGRLPRREWFGMRRETRALLNDEARRELTQILLSGVPELTAEATERLDLSRRYRFAPINCG